MSGNLYKSFTKLLIVILALTAIALINKKEFKESKNFALLKASLEKKKATDSSYYFVGSSRVKATVDNQHLERQFKNIDIQNVGVSGASFLENCFMADYLIKTKGTKRLYIELSPLRYHINDYFLLFSEKLGIQPMTSARSLFHLSFRDILHIRINQINDQVFSRLSLKKKVKEVVNYKHFDQFTDSFGYSARQGSILTETPLFLKTADIHDYTKPSHVDLNTYKGAIDFLIEKAEKNNAEIFFFLPMTYNKEVEKKITVPLFSSIDAKNKLVFSEKFITEMSDKELLFDRNHYNQKGAIKYSELLFYEIIFHTLTAASQHSEN